MTQRLIDADALKDDILKSAVMIDDRGIQTGYEIAIELIKKQPTIDAEPHWIPCSERLPKIGTNVLITNDKGNVSYGRYRGVYPIDDDKIWWTWKKNTLENVLAWMPLPEPYEVNHE